MQNKAKTYNYAKFVYANDKFDANLNDLHGADTGNLMENGFWLRLKDTDIFFEFSHNVFDNEICFDESIALVFYSEDEKYKANIWL